MATCPECAMDIPHLAKSCPYCCESQDSRFIYSGPPQKEISREARDFFIKMIKITPFIIGSYILAVYLNLV